MEQTKNYQFFQNRACEYFPCHKGVNEADFNCLFCYCSLYALGRRCGGAYRHTPKGVKSCEACAFPHVRENYAKVIARFAEIKAAAQRMDQEEA